MFLVTIHDETGDQTQVAVVNKLSEAWPAILTTLKEGESGEVCDDNTWAIVGPDGEVRAMAIARPISFGGWVDLD